MIRTYGCRMGNNSFARIHVGMTEGLRAIGELAGEVPLDSFDEWRCYSGALASVGVMTGAPVNMPRFRTLGAGHKSKLFMLAPNSNFVPKGILNAAEDGGLITGWLVPSKWAKGVLEALTTLPVEVWQHGIDRDFAPNAADADLLRREYDEGIFSVVHLSSTIGDRKGTVQLIEAWCSALRERSLGSSPMLRVLAQKSMLPLLQLVLDEASGGDSKILSSVTLGEPLALSPAGAAAFYRHAHVVCQPSRSEGFGLVPLEARACGVPVVATVVTGHADHMRPGSPGVVHVRTGQDDAVDDGPGALSPSLSPLAVESALAYSFEHWADLQEEAECAAPSLAAAFSWEAVTRNWFSSRFGQKESAK